MSIKLTTVACTYAKRTLPLIGWIYSLFHSDESSIRDALKTVVHNVHYNKVKNIYLYNSVNRIEVEHKFNDECIAIELHCFEDKTVQRDEYITLRFPSIKHVLECESYTAKDEKAFKEKYANYLK